MYMCMSQLQLRYRLSTYNTIPSVSPKPADGTSADVSSSSISSSWAVSSVMPFISDSLIPPGACQIKLHLVSRWSTFPSLPATHMDASSLHDANMRLDEMGFQATALTTPLWPIKTSTDWPVLLCQTYTFPSAHTRRVSCLT